MDSAGLSFAIFTSHTNLCKQPSTLNDFLLSYCCATNTYTVCDARTFVGKEVQRQRPDRCYTSKLGWVTVCHNHHWLPHTTSVHWISLNKPQFCVCPFWHANWRILGSITKTGRRIFLHVTVNGAGTVRFTVFTCEGVEVTPLASSFALISSVQSVSVLVTFFAYHFEVVWAI